MPWNRYKPSYFNNYLSFKGFLYWRLIVNVNLSSELNHQNSDFCSKVFISNVCVAGDELLLENHSKEWDRIDIEVKCWEVGDELESVYFSLRGWSESLALRRSENRRNVNKVNMSQMRKRTQPFCHTRESGYPVGSFSRFSPGFLLEFTPYLIRGRNDKEEVIRTEVDLKSTYFRNPSPSRRGRI
jgi:hypothetical protein